MLLFTLLRKWRVLQQIIQPSSISEASLNHDFFYELLEKLILFYILFLIFGSSVKVGQCFHHHFFLEFYQYYLFTLLLHWWTISFEVLFQLNLCLFMTIIVHYIFSLEHMISTMIVTIYIVISSSFGLYSFFMLWYFIIVCKLFHSYQSLQYWLSISICINSLDWKNLIAIKQSS